MNLLDDNGVPWYDTQKRKDVFLCRCLQTCFVVSQNPGVPRAINGIAYISREGSSFLIASTVERDSRYDFLRRCGAWRQPSARVSLHLPPLFPC